MRPDDVDFFAGRHALVTGAGRGIGAEIARTLASAGVHVTLVARTADDVQQLESAIRRDGGSATAVTADITDVAGIEQLVTDSAAAVGRLDFVVSNAGGAAPAPIEATTASDLDRAFHFNVAAPFELVKAAAPHLGRQSDAAVVTISSMMGRVAGTGLIAYGTVKAATDHLTRQLALELAPAIRVNAVAPGIIATQAVLAATTPEVRAQIAEATPLRRLGTEHDVAAAVLWLLSPAASFLTGKIIEVDGGADRPLMPA